MISTIRYFVKSRTWPQVLSLSFLALFFIHYVWLLHVSFSLHQEKVDAQILLEVSTVLAIIIGLLIFSRTYLAKETFSYRFQDAAQWKNTQLIQALDQMDLIIVGLDVEGRVTLANQKTCENFGVKSAIKLLGKDWFSLCIPPEDRARVKQAFHEVIGGNIDPFRYYENEITFSDGNTRLLSWTNELIRNEQGEITGVLSSGKDVTEERYHKKELEHKTHLLNTVLNELPGPLLLQDKGNRILLANDTAARFLQMEREQLIGLNTQNLTLEQGAKKLLCDGIQKLHKTQRTKTSYGDWKDPKTDRLKYFRSVKKSIEVLGNDPLYLIMLHDITDLHSQTQALETEQNRFNLAVEGSQDGIWDWNMTTDHVFYSPRYAEMLGYSASQLTPNVSFWKNLLHPHDVDSAFKAIENHLSGLTVNYEHRHRLRCKNGSWKWVLARGKAEFDEHNRPVRMVGFQSDITEQMNHEKALAFTAKHDLLTELPNRFKLNELLQPAMAQCDTMHRHLALLYIDFDGFKPINDLHGYDAGDYALKALADRMRGLIGPEDMVARIGGDEFAVALTDIQNINTVLPLLKKLQFELHKPIRTLNAEQNTIELQITSSIGVSLYPQKTPLSPDTLLRQADQAMLQAKSYGKNTYRFFNVDESISLLEQHRQVRRIQKAIERNELVMHYQPKVQMDTGEVLGFEGLIRWQRPQDGLLNPDHFLPLIHHHRDIMLMLGEWVFEHVFQQLRLWNREGHVHTVSINVSTHELHKKNMHEYLKMLLSEFPEVSAQQIELEILETHALEDTETAFRIIQECQSLGIKVSLDDFGTGYSTLSYLKNLPVNTLKIDRSFVSDMLHDSASFSIMEAAMGLAQAFHCETIAEGVETVEQGIMLQKLGCKIAQGYVISKPLPPEQVKTWLDNWHGIPAWKDIEPVDAMYRELLFAENLHRNWMKSMESYVYAPDTRPLPLLESQSCFFGKWLHSKGRALLSTEQWEALNELHELMHAQAHRINTCQKKSETLLLYKDMKTTQQHFLEHLSKIHKEFSIPLLANT